MLEKGNSEFINKFKEYQKLNNDILNEQAKVLNILELVHKKILEILGINNFDENTMQVAFTNLSNDKKLELNELRLLANYLENLLTKSLLKTYDKDKKIMDALLNGIIQQSSDIVTEDDKKVMLKTCEIISKSQKADLDVYPIVKELREKIKEDNN